MTSTNINIGFGNGRNSSKVLKPPGGGSSDIFGAANGSSNGASNGSAASTPRSANGHKNHQVSNIFGVAESRNSDARRNVPVDSHNRLFGEVDRAYAPAKSHSRSNIPIGSDAIDSNGKANGYNGSNGNNGLAANGNGHTNNGNGHPAAKPQSGVDAAGQNGNVAKNEPELSPRSNHLFASYQQEENEIGGGSVPKRDGLQLSLMPTYDTNINGEVAPLTNHSNSSSTGTHTTTTTTASSDDSMKSPHSPRNPVTGHGIAATFRRPRKMDSHRDGNPVTGEGYKPPSAEINTTVPSLNGARQVINKNRVPPGGFSSGLW